jgi:hypothetical protein
MYRKIQASISARTGIPTASISWVEVQTGRSDAAKLRFRDKVAQMFAPANMDNIVPEKLIVVSCFTGLSGAAFLERLLKGGAGDDRLFGCEGWNSHPKLVEHFVHLAVEGGRVSLGLTPAQELEEADKINPPPYNPPFYLTRDFNKPLAPAVGRPTGGVRPAHTIPSK